MVLKLAIRFEIPRLNFSFTSGANTTGPPGQGATNSDLFCPIS